MYPAGVDYKTKIISLDEENIKLQIWWVSSLHTHTHTHAHTRMHSHAHHTHPLTHTHLTHTHTYHFMQGYSRSRTI